MAKYGSESEEDFTKMQQEAIERVREMQNRARLTLENAGMHIQGGNSPFPPAKSYPGYKDRNESSPAADAISQQPIPENVPPEKPPQAAFAAAPYNIPTAVSENITAKMEKHLGGGLNISLDHDQILLFSMISMLMQDGADKWLLLSLAYVLMS